MASTAERLLAAATASLEYVHGETLTVVSGPDAGRKFVAVVEIESDVTTATNLGEDLRPKRVARFRIAPNLRHSDALQTDDGRRWRAVRQPGASFLTVDFELVEITSHDS